MCVCVVVCVYACVCGWVFVMDHCASIYLCVCVCASVFVCVFMKMLFMHLAGPRYNRLSWMHPLCATVLQMYKLDMHIYVPEHVCVTVNMKNMYMRNVCDWCMDSMCVEMYVVSSANETNMA